MSVLPVLSAFVILVIIMAIFSVMAVDIFGERDPDNFKDLGRALFTVFRVTTGDSWSDLAREEMLLNDAFVRRRKAGEVVAPSASEQQNSLHTSDGFDGAIGFFFVCIVLICGLVLTNVVVAVLLDEFIKAVQDEKQKLAEAAMVEASHAFEHKGPLDRLLAPLTHFNDHQDLRNKISSLFHSFDVNDSGLLTKTEMVNGVQSSIGVLLSEEDCDEFGLNRKENYGGEVIHQNIHYEGRVKKRDQLRPDYKEKYFVLSRRCLDYYDDEETYRKEKGRSKRSIPIEKIKIVPTTLQGLDCTKEGYHFSATNLNDGEEIECACKTAIARNRWILLLKDAVTSAEGTDTMSEECFVKLIESQLKVFVQRRIARAMLLADTCSEKHGVLLVLKHLVGAIEKLTTGQERMQDARSGGFDDARSGGSHLEWQQQVSERIDAIEGRIDDRFQVMNQKIDVLLGLVVRQDPPANNTEETPNALFRLSLPPLPWDSAQSQASMPPISAYVPVEYPPDRARAASSRSGRSTIDNHVFVPSKSSRRHSHPAKRQTDQDLPPPQARVIATGVGLLPKGM